MTRTIRLLAAAAVVAAVLAPVAAGAALGDSRCSFNPSSNLLVVRAGNDAAYIGRTSDGAITLNGEVCTYVAPDGHMMAVTVRNTGIIRFLPHPDAPDHPVAGIDLRGGALAPGTPEAGSSDEIEFDVDDDIASLIVLGGRAATGGEYIAVGTLGINLNVRESSPDRDVVIQSARTALTFKLGDGPDRLRGGAYATGSPLLRSYTVRGGRGSDQISGGAAGDTLSGDGGDDGVHGGGGADVFLSERGDDFLVGGAADDTFYQGVERDGADRISGEDGFDTVRYQAPPAPTTLVRAGRSTPVDVTLDNVGNDGEATQGSVPGENDDIRRDIEHVVGGDAGDTLIGSLGRETLDGGPGDDTVDGEPLGSEEPGGRDVLLGSSGDDTLLAIDGVKDEVHGGTEAFDGGSPPPEDDTCYVDTVDHPVTGCESTFMP